MKKILLLILLFGFLSTLHAAEEEEEEEEEIPALAIAIDDEELIAAVDNLGPTASGFLSEGDFGPEDEDFIDPHVLRDFIESKGLIECRKKSGLLTTKLCWLTPFSKIACSMYCCFNRL